MNRTVYVNVAKGVARVTPASTKEQYEAQAGDVIQYNDSESGDIVLTGIVCRADVNHHLCAECVGSAMRMSSGKLMLSCCDIPCDRISPVIVQDITEILEEL